MNPRRARSVETGRPKPLKAGGSGTGSGRSHSRLGRITALMVAATDGPPLTIRLLSGSWLRAAQSPAWSAGYIRHIPQSTWTQVRAGRALRLASHSFQATRIWLALKIDE